MDQLIIPKMIFVFILITFLVDVVLILKGAILSRSLMGVKGLIPSQEHINQFMPLLPIEPCYMVVFVCLYLGEF